MLQALQMCLQQNNAEFTAEDRMFLHTFAPAIVNFTLWVIREAAKSGKKRLYFLARDGYYMYHAARMLGIEDIEYRYLKLSRYSIRSAQYHILGDKSIDYICTGGIDVTFEKIMKRAMMSEEEALKIAELAGYKQRYTEVLNYNEVMALKPVLLKIPVFWELLSTRSEQIYPKTVSYLRQEGLFDDVDYALVDSGWIGTLQRSLQQLVQKPVEGYYFGLFEIPYDMSKDQYHAYYFEPCKGFDIKNIKRKAHFANSLFEAVCSAPEGMTLGYKEENNRYMPQYSINTNPNAVNICRNMWLIQCLIEQYIKIADKISTENLITKQNTDDITDKILSLLMGNPVYEEARYFGSYIFCDDILEHQLQPVAARLTKEDIQNQRIVNKALIIKGIKKAKIHESAWLEGSVVLGEKAGKYTYRQKIHIASELGHVRAYKYIIHIRKALKKK